MKTHRIGWLRSAAAGLLALLVLPGGMMCGTSLAATPGTLADSNGEVVGWGNDYYGQATAPAGNFTAIASGQNHSLGVRTDGTLAGWGDNWYGQINVPSGTFTDVEAGPYHSLGIRTDGTLAGWGHDGYGQATVPTGTFIAVAGGASFSLGIKTDGTLAGWGSNSWGEINVPSGTFTAVAAGWVHSLGLSTSGTLAGWGDNGFGQITVPPGTFAAIAAGASHSLGLRSDGTLAGWGDNSYGETSVPSGTFAAIAAGQGHSLGIRADGTLVGWGYSGQGQNDVPSGTFVALADDISHSLALRARTEYDGDLLVSGSGLTANLNRTVYVAGNATIQTTMMLYNNPLLYVAGRVTFAPGSSVDTTYSQGTISSEGGIEILSGHTLTVPSMLRVTTSGPLMGAGTLTLDGAALSAGLSAASYYTGWLNLQGTSSLNFTGEGLITPQYLGVADGSEVRLLPGQTIRVGTVGIINCGSIQALGNPNLGAAEIESRAQVTNYASETYTGLITGHDAILRFRSGVVNDGAVALTGGTNDVFGDVQNNTSGNITITGGATAVFYDDVIQDGTLTIRQLGTSTATGIFLGAYSGGGYGGGGNYILEGDLRPGNSAASVLMDGNVALGSGAAVEIELFGRALGAEYDHVTVTGQLALDGALDVVLRAGFLPQAGDQFDILDFGSLDGTFDEVLLPGLESYLAWDTEDLYVTGEIAVTYLTFPGDANLDHVVDDQDASILGAHWQQQSGATWAMGDFNRDGNVNDKDAAILAAHWGYGTGEDADVPEPSTIVLLGMGAVGLLTCARRPG